MHRCPDCNGRGTGDPCPGGIGMYCDTCGGTGAVNFKECEECVLKEGRIKVLEAEVEQLQNSTGWQVQKSLGEDIQSLTIRAETAEKRSRELDEALNSAISSAVEARKERDAAVRTLVDFIDAEADAEGEDE